MTFTKNVLLIQTPGCVGLLEDILLHYILTFESYIILFNTHVQGLPQRCTLIIADSRDICCIMPSVLFDFKVIPALQI